MSDNQTCCAHLDVPTPRTDAKVASTANYVVESNFARQLERELIIANQVSKQHAKDAVKYAEKIEPN